MQRPYPPLEILETDEPTFTPANDLALWAKLTFIADGGKLANPDHHRLSAAHIGFLWANIPNQKQGKRVLGTAQLGKPMGSDAWKKGAVEQQRREWFGALPTFLITLDAAYAATCGNAEFCALVEHELYHCMQAEDEFGAPRFNEQTGEPVWAMRGHDVEQFIGVVKRYGADAAMVRELVEAAEKGPTVAQANITGACGTCLRLVA
jgi:hypothetical protein